ncbi:CDP-alcohol phosphatidyltransferase family protein [Paenibacillus segetis]|uniref:Phosphatidylglycerophosphate synthase n=1 Tax=Paenibacillus segetis TaxID=1325360 RepID=A0ABQ1YGM2_9BACL|nr:CDP-alcohol phosphatidyltransferase family protein [Paenibacillus segetis]GGH23815.1 CDP-alcohol phosphatidyltransferase [Paenibacillus segetis]
MKSIPNFLSFSRMLLSLVLLVVKPLSIVFYVLYIACGLSDMLDGYIARRTGVSSRLGAKLDTVADLIMTIVLFVILYPIVHLTKVIVIWIIVIGLIRVSSIVIVLMKYKSFAILHTYGNKITGMMMFIFPLLMPFLQVSVLLYIICIMASLSALEELAINLTSSALEVDKHSIFIK